MNKTKMVVLALAGLFAGLACATEYFVDGSGGDDGNDGLTELTAKRTIQAAVDLTTAKDIVTVLPGVYGDSEGSRRNPADGTGQADYRVVITNQLLLRSRDGAAKTIIMGHFGSGANNLGTGAIRGVYTRGVAYAAIEGFTITGCASEETAASGNAHYGTAVAGNWNNYVLGCVISNNYSVSSTIYSCNAAATLIIDNTSVNNGCIGVKGMRKANVLKELPGEKVDIVKYSEDPEEFVAASLAPARVTEVVVNADGTCEAHVPADQLSLAIGKEGQNVRLAVRLCGHKIDIKAE